MELSKLVSYLFAFDPETYFRQKGRVELSTQVFDYRSPDEIERDSRNLLRRIYRKEGIDVDVIIGVLRGSAYLWRIATDVIPDVKFYFMRVRSYTGVGESCKSEITQTVPHEVIVGKRVLVVEEVVDTGTTLGVVINHLNSMNPKEVITAALDYKPWSEKMPRFFERLSPYWIVYSYEICETIRSIMDSEIEFSEKIKILWRTGIPISEIRRVVEEEYGYHIKTTDYLQLPFQRFMNFGRKMLIEMFVNQSK